jgi:transposase-like protein
MAKQKPPQRSHVPPNTDWDAIRVEYVSTRISIAKLAAKHGVSENALEKRASKGQWADARRRMAEEIVHSADSALIARAVDALTEFNDADVKVAQALRAQVTRNINEAQAACKTLPPKTIEALARAAVNAQRIGRLALGMSTENSSVSLDDDDDTFATALAERLERDAQAEAGGGATG